MAIKAIINNTEKEIEQIKNSDEQDIDYVYSRIGDTEVEGEPPISIKSIGGELANYRIYGNTVGGESVGDRTGNLWDEVVEQGSFNGADGTETVALNNRVRSKNVTLGVGNYTISANGVDAVIVMMYLIDGTCARSESIANFRNLPFSFSLDAERIIRFAFKKNDNSGILPSDISNMMLNSGSTALPYEPYGYRVPVTISNGNDSQTIPIYLSEQIKKVGDEAEYISYSERKLHRVGADDINVTLPALSTIMGTNTFSVNTSIQPSNIYIKDSFDYKKVFTATRAIEDELPLNYKNIEDNDSTLSNYRIYGNTVNGENVGDLITEGEHAGEYKVPVTVEGKNLLPNTATSQTINGVTFTVNSDGSITCNGTASVSTFFSLKQHLQLEEGQSYYLAGCPTGGGGSSFRLYAQTDLGTFFYLDNGNGAIINYIRQLEVLIAIYSGQVCNNLIFHPMIHKADIEDDTYEPYHAPVTTPIYLPEPIKMVGDAAEYIDYGDQKMHRIGAEDIDVTLPELPTLTGTNVLSVGTTVQPSEVEIKGHIK